MQTFSQLRQKAGLTVQETAQRVGFNERTVYRWERGETAPRKPVIELMQFLASERVSSSQSAPFIFIDLFAGIGGMRRGFESVGGKCVFTSEWDRFSQETYRANYPMGHELAGDITKIPEEAIPAHDVLLAGFPCQPFSLAGVSKKNSLGRPHGFQCDVQGTLFFDVARIIRHHRPKAFLLENVKNLRSHDKGRTFDIIMTTLKEDLGYNVQTRVIDASAFVPQHRERIFIVGFREDNDFDLSTLALPDALGAPTLASILHPEDGSEEPDERFIGGTTGKVLDRYTLSDHLWGYLQAYAEKHRLAGNGFGFGLFGPKDVARTLSARYHKDGSEILINQKQKNPRRLTPRECARLMGFEKPGQQEFRIPVSDTQAYRQFGNAVVVPVVEAVAKHMAPFINEEMQESPAVRRKAKAVA
ncbi:MAG: DNA (cytosine-5-)-methyltransferase [Alphaproteobacteria bacterium]|nr:DNA (cytosine-5-)-methyltransferase [Alphaproteobacteria bacterium]MBU0799265.1 DNA (cytosine-5-)-methyltransferase [Alphaproteobacteria bacterium]MBU0885546.1 DNA (cytosine-5-)-methyltransferase [Alphaproteobacteria bacterium]MBU1812977.1 DNA (cytosine-5-)-methyltransferase [Alphaproteobacteria bacterium]MBU2090888.1 DNA (cytosine-5-)-methyltransferase [Alphaproteobacteria bacterium]